MADNRHVTVSQSLIWVCIYSVKYSLRWLAGRGGGGGEEGGGVRWREGTNNYFLMLCPISPFTTFYSLQTVIITFYFICSYASCPSKLINRQLATGYWPPIVFMPCLLQYSSKVMISITNANGFIQVPYLMKASPHCPPLKSATIPIYQPLQPLPTWNAWWCCDNIFTNTY